MKKLAASVQKIVGTAVEFVANFGSEAVSKKFESLSTTFPGIINISNDWWRFIYWKFAKLNENYNITSFCTFGSN